MKPTQAELASLLAYDPQTGVFVWKRKPAKRVVVGKVAGCRTVNGYWQIGVNWRIYKAHLLAWLYVYGTWPNGIVDHINGDPSDNRIANLRITDRAGNMQNQRHAHSRNRSSLLGAYLVGPRRWAASIQVDSRRVYLGRFDSAEAAHAAYIEAKRGLHATCTI